MDFIRLIVSIAICYLASIIGAMFTMRGVSDWYVNLQKPALTPPSWVFGPVWGLLFTMMGTALWLVWRRGLNVPWVKAGIIIFIIQLLFNVSWSIVFFGAHSIIGGLVVLVFLWIFIFLTLIVFFRVSKVAAYLIVPYLLWVTFAMYLNYSIGKLNP